MSPESVHALQVTLARIEERVREIQDDVRGINSDRRCAANGERLRTMERLVWGCVAAIGGIAVRLVYAALR